MLEAIRERATLAVILLGMIVLAVRLSGAHMHWSIDAPADSPMHEWAHHANGDHHAQHMEIDGHADTHINDHGSMHEMHGHGHGDVDVEIQALNSRVRNSVNLFAEIALVFSFLFLIQSVRVASRPALRPPDGLCSRLLFLSPLKTGPPCSDLN